MSIYKVQHATNLAADTTAGPSPALWANCPVDDIRNDFGVGYLFEDDFLNQPNFSATDSDLYNYAVYGDTGVTFGGLATAVGGVAQIAGNDADNDALVIRTGGSSGVLGKVTDTAGSNKKLWWEARIRTASIADDGVAIFCGLSAEISLAATDTVQTDDTGVLKTTDYIGFRSLSADGDGLDSVYITAGTEVVHKESAATLVADTWIKVGGYFDGKGYYYYINGQQIVPTTAGGAADKVGILPSATSFPDGEEVGLMLATKVGTAAEVKVDIDWWRFAQLR